MPCDGPDYGKDWDCRDTDSDGLPNALDDDDDNDDIPDVDDPDPLDPDLDYGLPKDCVRDDVPPTIALGDAELEICRIFPELHMQIGVRATDDSCGNNGHIDLTASAVEMNGFETAIPISMSADGIIDVNWSPGEYLVKIVASDVNGNKATATKRVSIKSKPNSPTLCCLPHQTEVNGSALNDVHLVWPWNDECVFGRGAPDSLTTLDSRDYLAGGGQGDLLIALGDENVLAGGGGNDVVTINGDGGAAYGGRGRDVLSMHRNGDVWGGPGADLILGGHGDQHVRPGAGADFVSLGAGDDRISLCRADPGEVIDGGPGSDTLVTPMPVSELLASGVIVVNVEHVIMNIDPSYVLECGR